MLTPEMKEQLLEAAKAWAGAASQYALEIEYGFGKAVDRAEQAQEEAAEEFKKLLDQA